MRCVLGLAAMWKAGQPGLAWTSTQCRRSQFLTTCDPRCRRALQLFSMSACDSWQTRRAMTGWSTRQLQLCDRQVAITATQRPAACMLALLPKTGLTAGSAATTAACTLTMLCTALLLAMCWHSLCQIGSLLTCWLRPSWQPGASLAHQAYTPAGSCSGVRPRPAGGPAIC